MTTSSTRLIPPVGGHPRRSDRPRRGPAPICERAPTGCPPLQLSERALYDLELLATGAFSPLDRFMGRADYERVVARDAPGRRPALPDPGHAARGADAAESGSTARSRCATPATSCSAIMTVEEVYRVGSRGARRSRCSGTLDMRHPLVAEMHALGRACALSGPLRVLALPPRHDFRDLRLTPARDRGPGSTRWAPPTWSPSRRATRCTGRTRS